MINGLPKPMYDVQYQRVVTIEVKVGSLALTCKGTSKKVSKRKAAEMMYEKLKVRSTYSFKFALESLFYTIRWEHL